MFWLASVAIAGDRAALPALPVERPLQTPRGWTRVDLDRERLADEGWSGGEVRYGVSNRVELGVRLGLATAIDAGPVPADPRIRARTSLLRREPPSTSVVADLEATAPQGYGEVRAPTATVALAAAQQSGPFLLTLRGGWTWAPRGPDAAGAWVDPPDLPFAEARLLLQAGPLGPTARVWTDPVGIAWVAGIGVQLSRALDVHGEWGRVGDSGRAARIGVGVAF